MSGQKPLRSGVLTFTTDFGTRDHYVGAMRGVVASVAPEVRVIDITHGVPSYDIAEGAFAIAQAYACFPNGTVHVVVVDPGVGSARRPIAVKAGGHLFVAPDNGVLSQVLDGAGTFEARCIDTRLGLAEQSATFHGRDLFSPVGALLARGLPFADAGEAAAGLVRLPAAGSMPGGGIVLHVDRFGNLVTSFREADMPAGAGLEVAGQRVSLRSRTYAAAPRRRPFLIVGSSGYVEVSLNQGSAAEALGARAGCQVSMVPGRLLPAGGR